MFQYRLYWVWFEMINVGWRPPREHSPNMDWRAVRVSCVVAVSICDFHHVNVVLDRPPYVVTEEPSSSNALIPSMDFVFVIPSPKTPVPRISDSSISAWAK